MDRDYTGWFHRDFGNPRRGTLTLTLDAQRLSGPWLSGAPSTGVRTGLVLLARDRDEAGNALEHLLKTSGKTRFDVT